MTYPWCFQHFQLKYLRGKTREISGNQGTAKLHLVTFKTKFSWSATGMANGTITTSTCPLFLFVLCAVHDTDQSDGGVKILTQIMGKPGKCHLSSSLPTWWTTLKCRHHIIIRYIGVYPLWTWNWATSILQKKWFFIHANQGLNIIGHHSNLKVHLLNYNKLPEPILAL